MKPYYQDPAVTIYCGNALAGLREFPDESVQCCVTSPPYWGLRDYGVKGQLGLERTPEEYVERIVEIFREIRRVLRKDGTVWLNLGDTYTYAKGPGLKPKDLTGVPWRTAFALQAEGWYLRSDIIWEKPTAMPESVKDRPTRSHEYVFLMSKSERYYYDYEAIKVPCKSLNPVQEVMGWHSGPGSHTAIKHTSPQGKWAAQRKQSSSRKMIENTRRARENGGNHDSPFGTIRNRRTVWTIKTEAYSDAHFATFPTRLVEPCILAGCPASGVVLDPFLGSGTTAMVAQRLGRKSIGIEINEEYCRMAIERTAQKALGI